MLAWLSVNLLWSQGSSIVFILLVSSIFGLLFYRPLFYACILFLLFSLYFFRNPERQCSAARADDAVLVCPADGTVVNIQFDEHDGLNGYAQKVSIFLSPFDAHVMWTPMAGEVERVVYKTGAFTFAFLPKSSELNERNDIILHNASHGTVMVRQIAGTFARRICCWVHAGDVLPIGHKYGMIRFGSRVDLFLPATVTLMVSIGQKVLGGHTQLGKWNK